MTNPEYDYDLVKFYLSRWKFMDPDQRKLYYYLFLKSLDKYLTISDVQRQVNSLVRDVYCDPCPHDHVCCRDCIIHAEAPCIGRKKAKYCTIWFCESVMEKLSKKIIRLLGVREFQKSHIIVARSTKYLTLPPCSIRLENVIRRDRK